MNQKFIKASVQSTTDGIVLRCSCLNGGDYSGSRVLRDGTTYVNNAPMRTGESLMFSEDEAGNLIGGYYPYGDPQGDVNALKGGKGKGHLIDSEQMARSRSFPGQEAAEYGTRGRSVVVQWINGIPIEGLWIHKIADPGINFIPNGQPLYFHVDVAEDGTLEIAYVSFPSKGSCDDPA